MTSSPSRAPLAILGYGLCTPLGLGARVTGAEIAAGTSVFADTDVSDRTGEPARASRLSLIPPGLGRTDRMTLLARTALNDLLVQAPPEVWDDRMPILLAVPALAEGGAALDLGSLAAATIADLAQAGTPVAPGSDRRGRPQPRLIPRGRAGLFQALADAERLLESPGVDAVLIGAVDSLCDQESMQSLARANRILCAANPDGLIPGEAAGFLVVARSRHRGSRGRLLAHATAQGAGRDAPPASAGQALTAVLLQLASSWPTRAAQLLSAQPGERCWARELGVAMLRAPGGLPEPFASRRITESVGDAGAAAAVVLTIAALAARLAPSAGPTLVYGSADDGLVGGLLVEAA